MSGVEADCSQVAECANFLAFICRTECVATVLDKPEIVFSGEGGDGIKIENIAESKGNELQPPGLLATCRFQLRDIDFIGRKRDIDENRHEPVLNDRVYRGWKARRDGDDLVARPELLDHLAWVR